MDNLENGWLCSEDKGKIEYIEDKKLIGTCEWCGKELYEDEEYYTYAHNESGELLCWDCYAESKEQGVA